MPDTRYPPVGLDDRLRFGKHKGRELWAVLKDDPGWIRWAVETGALELDNEAWAEYEKHNV